MKLIKKIKNLAKWWAHSARSRGASRAQYLHAQTGARAGVRGRDAGGRARACAGARVGAWRA